jgi:hypothetical protein
MEPTGIGGATASSGQDSPRFELVFEQTMDDIVAFYAYGLSSIAALRNARRSMYAVPVLLSVLVGLVVPLGWAGRLLATAGAALVLSLVMYLTWRQQPQRMARSLIADGHNRMVFGERRIVIDRRSFATTGHHGSSVVRWSGIERVECDGHAMYLFINAQSAFIVPRRAMAGSKAFDSMLAWCRYWHTEAMRDSEGPHV